MRKLSYATATTITTMVLLFGIQSQALALTGQQNKMKTCNAEAKTRALKGDERKAFMKECLSSRKDDKEGVKAEEKPVK